MQYMLMKLLLQVKTNLKQIKSDDKERYFLVKKEQKKSLRRRKP
jgi:hypothetical protein